MDDIGRTLVGPWDEGAPVHERGGIRRKAVSGRAGLRAAHGSGLHSSTFQLNLSRLLSLTPPTPAVSLRTCLR